MVFGSESKDNRRSRLRFAALKMTTSLMSAEEWGSWWFADCPPNRGLRETRPVDSWRVVFAVGLVDELVPAEDAFSI
jgi:hypothetical protein